jgi:hypothetical protein
MNRLSGYILNLYFRFPGIRLFFTMIIIFIIFSIISVALMISDEVKTDPVGWDRMKFLSPARVPAKNVHAGRRGNLVAVVFEGSSKNKTVIYATLSFNGGNSFTEPSVISEFDSEISSNPRVAVSGNGEVYITWYVISGDESESRIYLSKSSDMGVTWSNPDIITFGMQMEILPEPAFDDKERFHLFFTSYSGNSFNLFHASMDENKIMGKPQPVVKVKGAMRGAFSPAIKFVKNYVVVVCQGKEESYTDHLYFTISDDYGKSWSGMDRITTGKFNNQSPAIEVYDDTVYLVYMNNSEKNWSINMLRGYRLGSRWDPDPLKISTTNANCYSPDITISPDNEIFITWHDLREKGSRIFYRKYSVKGKELLPESKLSVMQASGRDPLCITTNKKLLVMWEEGGRIALNFNDSYVMAPSVYSSSHPEDKWSRENSAVIRWNKPYDESGIAGYASITDKNPYTNPTIQNQRSEAASTLVTGLDDGITYFHIRAIDGAGNMSRTVHYKLQVSSNPLATPVIVSSTHPQNIKSDMTDAVFRWAVNDSRRLKGFIYSISKDTALKPEKFLKDFEIQFSGLESGIYYFNLAAVSTTNQISRVSTYSFIVGEGVMDQDYLKNLANKDYIFKDGGKTISYTPTVEINLPFGESGIFNSGSFTALLKPRHISPSNISGYSVVVGSGKKVPADKINLMSGILNIEGLVKGNYTIGVKCRYFNIVNGKKKYYWTEPVYKSFSIVPDAVSSPLDRIYSELMEKFKTSPYVFSMIILLFSITVVYRGYGNRISFYIKMINYKLRYYFG